MFLNVGVATDVSPPVWPLSKRLNTIKLDLKVGTTMDYVFQEPVKVAIHFLNCSSAYSRILQMITNESLRLESAHKLHNCIKIALTVMVLTL